MLTPEGQSERNEKEKQDVISREKEIYDLHVEKLLEKQRGYLLHTAFLCKLSMSILYKKDGKPYRNEYRDMNYQGGIKVEESIWSNDTFSEIAKSHGWNVKDQWSFEQTSCKDGGGACWHEGGDLIFSIPETTEFLDEVPDSPKGIIYTPEEIVTIKRSQSKDENLDREIDDLCDHNLKDQRSFNINLSLSMRIKQDVYVERIKKFGWKVDVVPGMILVGYPD